MTRAFKAEAGPADPSSMRWLVIALAAAAALGHAWWRLHRSAGRQRMLGSQNKLSRRRRRPILHIGKIAIFRTDVHNLLALDGEQGRDQSRALDRGDAGSMHKAEVAHVFAG